MGKGDEFFEASFYHFNREGRKRMNPPVRKGEGRGSASFLSRDLGRESAKEVCRGTVFFPVCSRRKKKRGRRAVHVGKREFPARYLPQFTDTGTLGPAYSLISARDGKKEKRKKTHLQ